MTKYDKVILNQLIDKYERSKSFTGDNQKSQSFFVKLIKLYPKYGDETEYELLTTLNESVLQLEQRGYIVVKRKKNGLVDTIKLELASLNDVYKYLSRVPKADINEQLISILDKYTDCNDVLNAFCNTQKERLLQNKKAELFDGDLNEYERILKAVSSVFDVNDEIYIRDFSIKVFGDSKVFERIKSKVKRLLFQYGDFPQEDTILEDLNIVKNPGHVFIKGSAEVTIKGQKIDLEQLDGDIALSSSLLSAIDSINITGNRVVTIENLTTFHAFNEKDAFAVYLGGYHNSHRRNFILQIYNDNPCVEYYHYGDIDAGGFYILLHLRDKTGVRFEPYQMGIDELKKYSRSTKPLTENDVKRLKNLMSSEFADTVNYMLEHNCKLEQEAMDV